MYESSEPHDSGRTAFRKAEKMYKLYYNALSSRKKKPLPTDLSEVFDFKSILESFNQEKKTPPGIFHLECGNFHRPIFCFENCPGFYFVPGALGIEEQCYWVRESLTSFPQPPNRTNHSAMHGPLRDLFIAASEKKILVEVGRLDTDVDVRLGSGARDLDVPRWEVNGESFDAKGDSCNTVAASILLRKLRWSTLGLQFDWSKRNYDVSLPHRKIPTTLCQLAKNMAVPALPLGEEFQPEAAIVNYFGSGDMLGGHLDDMEADWSKPIVSISLGCKAIFLLGGKSREDPPVAMFLRSGDIVLMAGPAREIFHGIPRIFTDDENAEVSPLISQFSHPDDLCFSEYVRTSRININIRQVH